MEPIYIRQTGESEHLANKEVWFKTAATDGRSRGATFFRFSIHPTFGLLLIEGWETIPRDQGPVRWQIAAGTEE